MHVPGVVLILMIAGISSPAWAQRYTGPTVTCASPSPSNRSPPNMDVLDPREVEEHGNKVPGGPSSAELARLFEQIFHRYPKASAIGFATIPAKDPDGLSIAALNRMITGAVRGVMAREAAAR